MTTRTPNRRPFFWIAILTVGIVAAMLYSFYIGRDLAHRSAPLLQAATKIKLEATTAHLWFEELMGGDQSINIDDIWRYLDKAEWYAQAMLEGGSAQGEQFIALKNPVLRQKIQRTIEGIQAFRGLAKERLAAQSGAEVGSDTDQRFDAMFLTFLASADDVATSLQQDMQHQLLQFRTLQGILAAIIIFLAILTYAALRRHEHRRLNDIRTLQEREENLRTTLNAIGDAVIVTDANGNISRMNPIAERLTGWTTRDVIGQPLSVAFTIINGLTREPLTNPVKLARKTGEVTTQGEHTVLIRKDGNECQISDSAAPIKSSTGDLTGVVLVFRDITEDYTLHAALQKSQQQLQSILDHTPAIIYIKDKESRYQLVNRQFEKLFNVTNAAVNGRTDYDLFSQEIADKFRKNDLQVLTTQAPIKIEEVAPLADGLHTYMSNKFPLFDENNNITEMCGISTDITDILRSEKALKESESNLLEAQKIARLGHYAFDINTLTWTNSAELDDIFGLEESYVKDIDGWIKLIHPDHRDMMLAYMKNDVLTQHQKFDREYKIIHLASGTEKWVHGLGELKFVNGKPVEMFGTILDITERKHAADALQRAQKMEAFGQLSGGIAHDFNNQLGVIIGYLDFLKEHIDSNDKASQWVKTASTATLRCIDLTRQLLTFSRHQVTAMTVINLNDKIKELETMIARSVTPAVDVQTLLADDLWLTEVNAGEFHDAILNLAINARDAMPDGGTLLIETSNKDLDSAYAARNPDAKEGHYIQLTLSDTGSGMTPETLAHVFEPFFTTKPEGQGTGLGLAMVYGFVKRYAGHIKLHSEMGIGTTIHLYLPRSRTSSMAVNKPIEKETVLPTGSESILIVDDENDLLELANKYLTELGYRTHIAANAAQALAILEHQHDIDLLFSDVVMPGGINGYQLAEQAAQQKPKLKVLLTSGFTSKTISQNGLTQFSNHLLGKPYRKKDLAHRIRRVLDESSNDSKRPGITASDLMGRKILVIDDEQNVLDLFSIHLERLGCQVSTACDSTHAIAMYQQSLQDNAVFDVVIMDLTLPGGMGGKDIATELKKIHPQARLIVSSGHSTGPEMTRPQDFGFDASLEKTFNRAMIQQVLMHVLA